MFIENSFIVEKVKVSDKYLVCETLSESSTIMNCKCLN